MSPVHFNDILVVACKNPEDVLKLNVDGQRAVSGCKNTPTFYIMKSSRDVHLYENGGYSKFFRTYLTSLKHLSLGCSGLFYSYLDPFTPKYFIYFAIKFFYGTQKYNRTNNRLMRSRLTLKSGKNFKTTIFKMGCHFEFYAYAQIICTFF